MKNLLLTIVSCWHLLPIVTFVAVVASDDDYMTFGSAVKLLNQQYKVRLHSHDVKYGTGSGQQSVTGMNTKDDANSYWQIRSPTDKHFDRGTPIKCGQAVRLMHIKTTTNLHSHHFKAPMSNDQEVSAFGEGGEGDHLDNWEIVCSGDYWKRNEYVKFQHQETRSFLACTSNTYGRPIHGQQEIVAAAAGDQNAASWKAAEGVILRPSENMGVQ